MKPQDLLFSVIFLILLYLRNPRYAAIAGLLCIIAAIPLFAYWIFFTAERLTWYAAAFFLLSTILSLYKQRAKN